MVEPRVQRQRDRLIDGLIFAAFLLIACKYQLTALSGEIPQIIANTDSGNVAGFIAGWLYPERFSSDLVLNDTAKFGWYITLIIPLVMLIDLLVNDLGRSFVLLLLPLVFMHASGFYLLGRRLDLNRAAAATMALVTLAPIWTLPGDFWGVLGVPLTRVAYGALFPFIVLAALGAPKQSPSLYRVAGLCVLGLYLHPVSGLSVAAAIYLTLLFYKPVETPGPIWLKQWVASGFLFAAAIIPFAVIYLINYPSFSASSDPTTLSELVSRLGVYNDAGMALQAMVEGPCCNPHEAWGWRWLVWIGGLFGLLWGALQPGTRRPACRFLTVLLGSLVLFSFGVAYLDQAIANLLDRTPGQTDLIRNMRYLVPVLLIGLFIGIQQILEYVARFTSSQTLRIASAALLLGLTLAFAVPYIQHSAPGYLGPTLTPTPSFRETQTGEQIQAALRDLRSRPGPMSILPLTDEITALSVRYGALQGVGYIDKDANVLLYSSNEDVERWMSMNIAMRTFRTASTAEAVRASLCSLIAQSQPTLVLVDRLYLPWHGFAAVDDVLEEETRFGDFVRLYKTTTNCEHAAL